MLACISPIKQVQIYLCFCIYSSLETVYLLNMLVKAVPQARCKTTSSKPIPLEEKHRTILWFLFRKGVRQAEEKASTVQAIKSSVMSQVQMWLHDQMYSFHGCGGKATLPSRTFSFLKCLVLYTELEIFIWERKKFMAGTLQICMEAQYLIIGPSCSK